MKRLKGIYQDCDPIDQPEGTYRDAKNALLTKRIGAICSEEGNSSTDTFTVGHEVIGNVLIYDGTHIVFTTNGTDSEIGSFDGTTYSKVINDADITDGSLDFSTSSTIESVGVIDDEGNAIVYWTDGINPPRFINITEHLSASPPTVDDPDELNIFPSFGSIINVDLAEVNDFGGALESGVYQFAFSYYDDDENQTNYQFVTNPIHVTDSSEEGAVAGTTTSKSIDLDLSNIDTTYNSIQVAVIHSSEGVTQSVQLLSEINITGTTTSLTYSGQETTIEGSIEEVLVNNGAYATAKHMCQQDGVLYMANMSRNIDIGFQPHANNIKVELVTDDLDSNDGDEGFHYVVPLTAYQKKSFRRGAVYAFYISFILKDGTETYAYHIPGRVAENNVDGDLETLDIEDGTTNDNTTNFASIDADAKKFHLEARSGSYGFAYWENEQETYPNNDNFNVYDVNSSGVAVDPNNPNGGANLGDTDIKGAQVRHHRIPENIHLPFCDPDTQTLSVTGIKVRDIKLTTEIYEQVKAFKIYHAEVTEDNEIVLGQGLLVPQEDFVGSDATYHANDLPANPDSGTINTDVFSTHDFRLLRTRNSIATLAYVKNFANAGNDNDGFGESAEYPDDAFTAELFPISYSERDTANLLKLIDGNAKSYADSNIGEVNLTVKGFDQDKRATLEESQMLMKFTENLSRSFSVGDTTLDYSWLSNFYAHKTDLYNSFDQQVLAWTGFIETNMDNYYPASGSFDTGDPSTGSIEITGAGSGATKSTVLMAFSGTPDQDGTIRMDASKTGYTFTSLLIPILSTDTLDEVIDKVVDEINNDSLEGGSELNFSATNEGSGSFTIAVDNPVGEDGDNISIAFFDDSDDSQSIGSLTLDGPDSTSGGSDGVLSFTINGIRELYFNIPSSSTTTAVAEGLRDYMNNNSGRYTATVNTGGANPIVEITSKFNSVNLNGEIVEEINQGGATYTAIDLASGTDPSNVTAEIYGGDTYLGYFGYRVTSQDDTTPFTFTQYLFRIPVECRDNVSLRHTGDNYGEDNANLESLWEAILNWEEDSEDEEVDYYDNYYGYDLSYSLLGTFKGAPPFPKNLSSSSNSYPTRTIRSQQAEPAAVGDNLRVFLENDFLDFPRNRGEITNLAVSDNNILVHMERGLFLTRGREEFVTGDIRAYVGSGDIFAIKPNELKSTDIGFGGQVDQRAAITTPHGYFFVDRKAGEVFLIGQESSSKISDLGLKNFFNDELKAISTDRQLIATWDNKWDRIILTYRGNWTVSYYPELQAWGSFHSYDPDYYLPGVNTFYSVNSNTIYEHNVASQIGSFFGSLEDFEFEFVENRSPSQSKTFYNIMLITEVVDQSGDSIYNETFDKFRVFNDLQDSGDLTSSETDIVVYSSLGDSSNARRVEGTWKINKFRDLLVNGSIDTNKPWQDQSRFIGKYVRVKLVFNNTANKSLYLYDTDLGVKLSNR